MNDSPFDRQTAIELVRVFELTYQPDAEGVLRNKVGRRAPNRSIDIYLDAAAIVADQT